MFDDYQSDGMLLMGTAKSTTGNPNQGQLTVNRDILMDEVKQIPKPNDFLEEQEEIFLNPPIPPP